MPTEKKAELLKNFVDSALELMKAGLADLCVEKALLVSRAQAAGADIGIVFFPGAGTIVGCLHFPADQDAEPATLFRIVLPVPEGTTN
jgi:hypothetical protein